MALDLEQELGSGATGQYWRITRYTVDRADNTLRVALHLYKSRSARLDGKFPMLEKELVVPLTDSSHTIADV